MPKYVASATLPAPAWTGTSVLDGDLAGAGTYSDMLFSAGLSTRLDLVDAKTLASGVVILSYRPS